MISILTPYYIQREIKLKPKMFNIISDITDEYPLNANDRCSIKEKNSCRLRWGLTFSKLVYLYLFLYFSYIVFQNQNSISPMIFVYTLILAVLYAIYKKSTITDIFGSVWCFLSVIYGPAKLLNL